VFCRSAVSPQLTSDTHTRTVWAFSAYLCQLGFLCEAPTAAGRKSLMIRFSWFYRQLQSGTGSQTPATRRVRAGKQPEVHKLPPTWGSDSAEQRSKKFESKETPSSRVQIKAALRLHIRIRILPKLQLTNFRQKAASSRPAAALRGAAGSSAPAGRGRGAERGCWQRSGGTQGRKTHTTSSGGSNRTTTHHNAPQRTTTHEAKVPQKH